MSVSLSTSLGQVLHDFTSRNVDVDANGVQSLYKQLAPTPVSVSLAQLAASLSSEGTDCSPAAMLDLQRSGSPQQQQQQQESSLLAAIQSVQMKLKLQEQTSIINKLERENAMLTQAVAQAHNQIGEFKDQLNAFTDQALKMQAQSQLAEQQHRTHEQLLQQRCAEYMAKSYHADDHIKKLQDELKEVHLQFMTLKRANEVLSLGVTASAVGAHHKWPRSVGPNRTPSSIASRKCYNCGQKGHKASDCPNPRTRPDIVPSPSCSISSDFTNASSSSCALDSAPPSPRSNFHGSPRLISSASSSSSTCSCAGDPVPAAIERLSKSAGQAGAGPRVGAPRSGPHAIQPETVFAV